VSLSQDSDPSSIPYSLAAFHLKRRGGGFGRIVNAGTWLQSHLPESSLYLSLLSSSVPVFVRPCLRPSLSSSVPFSRHLDEPGDAARLDPPNDSHSIDALVLGVTGLFGAVHLLGIGGNLSYRVPMSVVVAGTVLSTVVLAGYVVLRETTA